MIIYNFLQIVICLFLIEKEQKTTSLLEFGFLKQNIHALHGRAVTAFDICFFMRASADRCPAKLNSQQLEKYT